MAHTSSRRRRRSRPPSAAMLLAAAIVVAAVGFGCGRRDVSLDDTSALTMLGVELDHPDDFVVTSETNESAELCFLAEVGTRFPRCLTISAAQGGELSLTRRHNTALEGGGSFLYDLSTASGGSGGEEHLLAGFVSFGVEGAAAGREVAGVNVKATAGGDYGFDDATWALPIVESIRRIS